MFDALALLAGMPHVLAVVVEQYPHIAADVEVILGRVGKIVDAIREAETGGKK
jgi:hypothetical protein